MLQAGSTSTCSRFSAAVLKIDAATEVAQLERRIRDIVFRDLRRRGAVVGLSGGIDSSVTAALCARALGSERVFGLMMPEADSSSDSLSLGRMVADHLGIASVVEDITPILSGMRCYERRDEAIREVIPDFGAGWRSKISLPDVIGTDTYAIHSIVVQSPSGEIRKARLTADAYLRVVAATNFKQRARKVMEYHHADRLQYAVAGTPNRLEYDQGFFVKLGDGSADFKPIAHLYKSQVYDLAEYLGIPPEIRHRPPTTDTYSLEQSQEEFYFSLPLREMDLCLYGRDHEIPAAQVGEQIGLSAEQVSRIYRQIDSKRRVCHYLHREPVLAKALHEAS